MALYDDILRDALTVSAPTRRRTRDRAREPYINEEEERDLLSSIGHGALSGLGYVGESLGKPAAALSGLLMGRPEELANLIPFSDALGITSSEGLLAGTPLQVTDDERTVYGGDVMEHYGLIPENEEGFDPYDIPRLAGDILVDPLTPFTLGGRGALTAGGKALHAAGLLDEGLRVGGTLGRGGRRLSSATTTAREALEGIAGQAGRGGAAGVRAQKAEQMLGELAPDMLDEVLGGAVGYGFPFGETRGVLGTGKTAQKYLAAVDRATEAIKYGNIPGTTYSPGRHFSAIMRAATRGSYNKTVQKWAEKLTVDEHEALQGVLGEAYASLDDLERAGSLTAEEALSQRAILEGIEGAGDPNEALQRFVDLFANDLEFNRAVGVKAGQALEDVIEFAPRRLSRRVMEALNKKGSSRGGNFSAKDAASVGRDDVWKGFHQGTNGVNDLATDSRIQDIIAEHAATEADLGREMARKNAIEDIREYIENAYAPEVDQWYQVRNDRGDLVFQQVLETGGGSRAALDAIDLAETSGEMAADAAAAAREVISEAADEVGEKLLPRGGLSDETIASAVAVGGNSDDIVVTRRLGNNSWDEVYRPVYNDRHKELATTLFDTPEYREFGIFDNHWASDAIEHLVSSAQRREAAHMVYDLLNEVTEPGVTKTAFREAGQQQRTVSDLFRELGLNSETGFAQMMQREAPDALDSMTSYIDDLTEAGDEGLQDALNALESMKRGVLDRTVDPEIFDELTRAWEGFKSPEAAGLFGQGVDSLTNLFKAGVLTWPARYMRDIVSGQVRNFERGWFDFRSARQAHKVLQGRSVEGLRDIPSIQQWMTQKMGVADIAAATDEQATQALQQMYASMKASHRNAYSEIIGDAAVQMGNVEELMEAIPGRHPFGTLESAKKLGRTFAGMEPGTTRNPLDIAGIMEDLQGTVRTETRFGPVVAGNAVGRYTDDMNRLVPFINRLKAGVDPSQAMADIAEAQVEYAGRAFTPTERQLKRIFPFYSFTSRQIPYVAKQLMMQPGGRLAGVIKGSAHMQGETYDTPDYVQQTMSVPLGETEEGGLRFLTGLGLMHEDPLQMVGGGGVQDTLLELASRSNPLIKAPAEWMTGESFFQRGPLGGRDIEDLDPTIGRTMANIAGRDEPVPTPRSLEFILGNSPLSRALTSARTLTDTRKSPGVKALNLLTGARLSDISPRARDAIIRERAQARMDELGAKAFTRYYFPKEELEALPEGAEKEARKELQALINELARKAKAAKKAREAKERR